MKWRVDGLQVLVVNSTEVSINDIFKVNRTDKVK